MAILRNATTQLHTQTPLLFIIHKNEDSNSHDKPLMPKSMSARNQLHRQALSLGFPDIASSNQPDKQCTSEHQIFAATNSCGLKFRGFGEISGKER